jgi:CPA2 family monovalent cation:H+ antiporter-2
MLLDVRFLAAHAALVAVTVIAIVVAKTLSTAVPAWLTGFPLRTSLLSGAAIAQVGEFSFVLGSRGAEVGLLDADDYQTFLAAAVLTMAVTPSFLAIMPAALDRLCNLPFLAGALGEPPPGQAASAISGHVIIAGFGLNGRNLAAALAECGVPHVILELNPETVRSQRAAGLDIRYGDCTRAPILQHAGLERARALVIAISDPASTRRSVRTARELAPDVRILVRTEHVSEVDELNSLGADCVIPAEFETALALYGRVLDLYDVPPGRVEESIERMRRENYDFLRAARRV